MIIDGHCHAWERWPYDPPVPDPISRGRVDRLEWEMRQHCVARAILISAGIRDNPRNSDYTLSAARESSGDLIAFPDVDCRWSRTHHTAGAATRLRAIVAAQKPVGFAHYMNEKADPSWLVSRDGLAFFEAAAEDDLIVSLSCGPTQMPVVRALAEHFPQTPFLLHHLGWVSAAPAIDHNGLRLVLDGSDRTNIFIKLSGFGYAVADGWDFPCSGAREIARAIHGAYGPERLIWGSDYPVSQRYMTYRQTLEIVRAHCDFIAETDMPAVLGGNMRRLLETRGVPFRN